MTRTRGKTLVGLVLMAMVVGSGGTIWAATAEAAPAAAPGAAPGYPTTPPAQVCGNAALLTGPAVQPAGSVRVDPGTNLYDVTQANPPGTTFWLSPGTFTLGTGRFGQVIPKDGNTYIGAPGAILDGKGFNLYAFTQRAVGVTIEYLTIQNFIPLQDEAAVNHDSGSGWTIQYNTMKNMTMAAMNAGSNSVTRYNCLTGNGQTGINGLTGTQNVTIDHNDVGFNSTGPNRPGDACGCEGGLKLFGVQNVTITNNWIHDNASQGIWGDTNSVGWLIQGNYINNNANEAIFYETSYNAFINNNTIANNALVKGAAFVARGATFPIAAVYISESGGDARLYGGKYATLEISGNNFDGNWGGVTLWEDANRFCNTPGNTAAGFCPIAGVATPATCVAGTINNPPYYADCRWHTQNVLVDHNTFRIDKAALRCEGTNCGENSIFSQPAVSPPWSPYLGDKIQTAITFNQNNHYADNSYLGDWRYDAFAIGRQLSFAQWQAAPYIQDVGSTISRTNSLESDTSTLEGSIGHWIPWYNASVSRSTLQAHTGTHSLKVDVASAYWGVTVNNYPYFDAGPGPKTLSFWAMAPAGGSQGVTMDVTWRSATGVALETSSVPLATLTSTWQKASDVVTAPVGTVFAEVSLRGSTGIPNTSIYLDDLVIADGGTPPPPPPPPPAGDLIDAPTATLETSIGHWIPWYNAAVSSSPAQAHTGTRSLKVDIASGYWGVTLNNYPYYPATPGPKTLSFWAMAPAGGSQGVTMDVTWRSATGAALETSSVPISGLTTTWKQGTAVVTAPPGTVKAEVGLRSSSGIAGSSVFLDDFLVADGGTPPPPPAPPPANDSIDAATATLESSLGHWTPWYSTAVSQSPAQAHTGLSSLKVDLSGAYWGVTLDNYPYYAATPGPKTLSFWGMTPAGGSQGVTMAVTWRDATGAPIRTDSVTIAALSATWQQATAAVTAPAGTVRAEVNLRSSAGILGSSIYLDDFLVSI